MYETSNEQSFVYPIKMCPGFSALFCVYISHLFWVLVSYYRPRLF